MGPVQLRALKQQIERIEQGESDTLVLRRLSEPFELPDDARNLPNLRRLHVFESPEFRWPAEAAGWPLLERVQIRSMPFPRQVAWLAEVDLDLEWSDAMDPRAVANPERVRSLEIFTDDTGHPAEWPFTRLDTLELHHPSPLLGWDGFLGAIGSRWGQQMRALYIRGLDEWSRSIQDMPGLERLSVTNGPPRLDIELSRLPMLRALDLYASAVDALPDDALYWPPNIETLQLGNNSLSSLPSIVGRLEQLRWLDLGGNRFSAVPDALRGHQTLSRLDLDDNPLAEIPRWLFTLPQLQTLNLHSSSAKRPGWTLPSTVLHAANLTHLDVDPRHFDTPPPEVMAQGLPAIKTYWRQREGEEQAFLSEAKLLIVGEPGAGKTTLARRLSDPDAAMPADDESTEGIDVRRWGIDGHVRCDGKSVPQWIDVNIWDFGGQEIYHATHQFFLSQRAVYVLVTDGRREDTDFHYWLRAVDLFGQGSPVLIVLNTRHGRTFEVDVDRWRRRFPALIDAMPADLSQPDDVRRVRRALEGQILALEHLSTPFPASWRNIRDTLEARRRAGTDHITLDDYLSICRAHGFVEQGDMLILSRFLHDIGVCLHFQDVATLLKTVILEPEWGTDAVYRVLDHGPIKDARGRFTDDMLAAVWSEARYDHMYAELLALMRRFGLCYPLPGGQGHIAPQLLSKAQPSYRLPSGPAINLRYRYDFMPKGIVTRFIVMTHDLIDDQRHVWRNGVVLRRREAWCEVIEDYPGREITVRVVGDDARSLAAIVDRELERIHDGFKPALQYDTWVPCSCDHCVGVDAPMLFAHSKLVRYAENRESIKCDHSFDEVDPRALIDGALPERDAVLVAARPEDIAAADRAVFVSYAWKHPASVALVEQLQARCDDDGVDLKRDNREVRYRESFQRFMDRLGAGRCVVVVLSPAYFESRCCMYELLTLAEHRDWIDRVYPIVAAPDMFDDERALDAELHWQAEYESFAAKVGQLDPLRGQKHAEGLRARRKIADTVGELHRILADLNMLPDVVHGDAPFDGIMQAIRARIDAPPTR